MNLDQYLKIAKSHILFITTLTAIGLICGYLSTTHIKSGYRAQQTVFVKIEKIDPTAQDIDPQTTTDTIVAFTTDSNYQRSINQNGATAGAKKIAAQVVSYQATSEDASMSQAAIENTIWNFNSNSNNLINNAKIELKQIGTPAYPSKNVLNSKALALFGAIIGLVSSILIISTSRYFRL